MRRPLNSAFALLFATVLLAFVSAAAHPAPSCAQPSAAQHAVTIEVEEMTRISLSGDVTASVEQGSEKTVDATYSIRTNRPSGQTISASVEVEGPGRPSGIEVSAEMEAPGGGSSSTGPQTLPLGQEQQDKVLLEDLGSVSASGLGLTYRIDVSEKAPVGSSSISITYTVSES